MKLLLALCALIPLAWARQVDDIEPQRPVWPEEYKISFNFSVPYIDEYMPRESAFKYTYQAWQDTRLGRQKVVRNGVETVITLVPVNLMYEVFPAQDRYQCWKGEVHGGTGPTLAGAPQPRQPGGSQARGQDGPGPGTDAGGRVAQQRRRLSAEAGGAAAEAGPFLFDWEKKPAKLLSFLLPDLSEPRWAYAGTEVFKETGDTARVYEWDLTGGEGMEMKYRFYVTRDGVPLRLWMMGVNLLTGGHKDEYVATYYAFQPGPLAHEDWQLPHGLAPDDCVPAAPDAALAPAPTTGPAPTLAAGALRLQFAAHMPSVHWGHAAYDAFVHRHGRRHRHAEEYQARLDAYQASAAFVRDASAAGSGHRLALNHMADWTREEYLAVARPGRSTPRLQAAEQPGVRVHKPSVPPHMVPAEVIWRGTPADSPVKDQAACGSCWAFSTVGAIEAAWFYATGSQQLFSEQQMVDCGWDSGNKGCYGGDQVRALNWALKRGGLATQADYPYEGVNNFCRADVPQKKFKGNWVLVEGGEAALKEAVLTRGPMIVSIDASHDSFRFYAGGVYSHPDCATKPADLDHAVIISGYGTTDDGQDYWLVKNIWSPYWGEGGYMRVARGGNDCGVASEPVYVDLR